MGEVSVAEQFLHLFDQMTLITQGKYDVYLFTSKYTYCRSICRLESTLPKLVHCHRLSSVAEQLKFLQKKFSNFPMLILALIILDKCNPLQLMNMCLDV